MDFIAVATIIGIEAGIALPRLDGYLQNYRLNSATMAVWEDMHAARVMAIKEKRKIRVDLSPHSYEVVRADTGEVAFSRHLSNKYPGITIGVTDIRGGIVFDRTGSAEGGTREVEIQGPTGTRRFTIFATGKIGGLS